jgi:hypothetical protein
LPPDALELLLLQNAQQLDLDIHRQLAHLVHEERPLVRHLEPPDAPLQRAGESASFVTEQLALDESLRNGAAIHLDQGSPLSRARIVDGSCDELLARSGLTHQEDGGLHCSHLPDVPEHCSNGGALSNDRLESASQRQLVPRHIASRPSRLASC